MNTQPNNQEVECQHASQALAAYFDGTANDAEKQLAAAHLVQCSSCAQMWREWQSLRLMELRALEPVASGEMLPLAPVKIPLDLKAAILRKTVSPPIWQRFWPRLLTGIALPTFAVACWLLIVAAPWQQSMPEIISQSNPAPAQPAATIPRNSIPLVAPSKNGAKTSPITPEKFAPVKATHSTKIDETKTTALSHQTKPRPISVAPISRVRHESRVASIETHKRSVKSTFKAHSASNNTPSETSIIKPPQISMASLERPLSRAARSAAVKPVKPIAAVASKLRATAPVLVAEVPTQDKPNSADLTSDPMLNYVAQNDVRPDDIRQAVENYRAALLDDGSDL